MAIAGFGGADRAFRHPWIPVAATAKALGDPGAAAAYVYVMAFKERAWCMYCLLTAATQIIAAELTIPELYFALARVDASDGRDSAVNSDGPI